MKVKFFLAKSYFGHRNLGIAFLAPMKEKFFLAESLLGTKIWAETLVCIPGWFNTDPSEHHHASNI